MVTVSMTIQNIMDTIGHNFFIDNNTFMFGNFGSQDISKNDNQITEVIIMVVFCQLIKQNSMKTVAYKIIY
jgi:hypothetical protein